MEQILDSLCPFGTYQPERGQLFCKNTFWRVANMFWDVPESPSSWPVDEYQILSLILNEPNIVIWLCWVLTAAYTSLVLIILTLVLTHRCWPTCTSTWTSCSQAFPYRTAQTCETRHQYPFRSCTNVVDAYGSLYKCVCIYIWQYSSNRIPSPNDIWRGVVIWWLTDRI